MRGYLGSTKQLKFLLKKWPQGYEIARKTYYGFLYIRERWVLGSKVHHRKWKNMAAFSSKEFLESVSHPHRDFLTNTILRKSPFDSVLEVGCNMGQNLWVIAGKFPTTVFYGIDINPRFIEAGKCWFANNNIKNTFLDTGKAEELSKFGNKSIDITFTDATLLYLGPDKIEQSISEMVRVTRKSLLFNEWNLDKVLSQKQNKWFYGHWVYNYSSILSKYVPYDRIRVTKLPEGLWETGGGWEKYGALIEVDLGGL